MTPTPSQLARARYIRTILARHDHTQSDLGGLLGITQPSASRKLKGIRRFEVEELVLIAGRYNVDVALLIHPPEDELSGLLGPVRDSAQGLLTSTKYQVVLVSGSGAGERRFTRNGRWSSPGFPPELPLARRSTAA